MRARLLSFALVLVLSLSALTGCADKKEPHAERFYEYFDTVSVIYSYAGDTEEVFRANSDAAKELLFEYHRLFDIYFEYSGINNLCTVNKNAGIAPVSVDERLMDFLEYAIEICKKCDLEINIAMGSVLSLWHDARTSGSGQLPDTTVLNEAAKHTDIDAIIIDREAGTVYINDPDLSIDVGAVGKGYAVMKAAELLIERGANGYVIDVGGNIRVIGTKPDGNGWITGITDPDGDSSSLAARIMISDTSCVTSGDYERYYTVDGIDYHHIIDRDTLMPARYFSSVSVVCRDSALADALSTALFCMPKEEGMALLSSFDGVEAMWIYPDGRAETTDGFAKMQID